jgi:sugar lactone lactonase YvrE
MVLLADRSALIVAETRIGRLSKVCLDVEGNVVRRETFAQVPNGGWPDGICLDATGGVWAADPRAGACFRFDAAGEITQTLPTRLPPFACVLGGDDGRTLFVCMAPFTHPSQSRRQMAGAIEAFRVEVGADGWP